MTADGYEIYLEYGENKNKQPVHIADARLGPECWLSCLYCGSALIAKNRKFSGRLKQPHFAHEKDTCRYFSRYHKDEHFRIPLYQNFTWNLRLTKNQRTALQLLYREFGQHDITFVQRKHSAYLHHDSAAQALYLASISNCHQVFDFLKKEGFLEKLPEARQLFRLSNKGIIVNRGLSLAKFYTIQQMAIDFERTRLEDALAEVKNSRKKADLERRRLLDTDHKIFKWDLEKFARYQLYFLRIDLAKKRVYKIGITQRAIDERINEIRQDLKNLAEVQDIAPRHVLPAMSSVEPYFLLRFRHWQYKFSDTDSHTEYFDFVGTNQLPQVLQELQQLAYQSNDRRKKIQTGR